MNLFWALSRYAASSTVIPLENFSSELLAWVIRRSPRFGEQLVTLLLGPHERRRPVQIKARTQRFLDGYGVADIEIEVRFVEGAELDILLENKIEAAIGERGSVGEEAVEHVEEDGNGANTQIDNYLKYAASRENVRVALLSKRRIPVPASWQCPYWLGAHRWFDLAERVVGVPDANDQVENFVLSEFHAFLVEAGMALEPVREPLIEGARERLRLLNLFEEAAQEVASRLEGKGIEYPSRGSDSRRLGLWAYWQRHGEDLAGIAFSDTYGDTALCLYPDFGTDIFARLSKHTALKGLKPPKSGRFWGSAYVPFIDLQDGFLTLSARDQLARLTETSCKLLTAVLDVLDAAESHTQRTS